MATEPEIPRIDYQPLSAAAGTCSQEELIAFLTEELPYFWCDAYMATTSRQTNIVRWQHSTFEYIFDDYATLEAQGYAIDDPTAEARLVATFGHSNPLPHARSKEDARLRGWIGPTGKTFGNEWDKGHFIAHTIGGAIDGNEANIFLHRRDLNRGWSDAGKRYREMEIHCAKYPKTFCFSRPIYNDQTAKPRWLEFGLLKNDGELWVECFDNG